MEKNYLFTLVEFVDDSIDIDPDFIDEYWDNLPKQDQKNFYNRIITLEKAAIKAKIGISDLDIKENYILVLCDLIDEIDEADPNFLDEYWNDLPSGTQETYFELASDLGKAVIANGKNIKSKTQSKEKKSIACGCGK